MSAEPQRPVITKELLRELGDWRAEKEGRTLAANGNVLQWEYQAPFLSGTVRTGELRIILEGSVDGGAFTPFDVISKRTAAPYAVSEADEVLLAEVEGIHAGWVPGVWMLTRDDADAFFDALTDHPRVWLGKKT